MKQCLSAPYSLMTFSSFCLCFSVSLRQLTEAVNVPNDDVTRGLISLPPQRDLEERTVRLYLCDLLGTSRMCFCKPFRF